MPISAVNVLARAAGKRKGLELIQTANAHRIAMAPQKDFEEAIKGIKRVS